ncbi:polysaccharide deacetylase family protein [Methanosarcina sp. T3]|uniref:polysaccharide deacetylase family protein n=1 Tax=Methanosarcina sp. T3 TaxID=3439062 RepID=UPI003F873DF1
MFEKLKENEELWALYTRKEEYGLAFRDRYERFPYYMSGHRNIFEPRVSKFLIENGLKPQYPDGKKFAVCLTHDIDAIHPEKLYPLIGSLKALAQGNLTEAMKTPFCRVNRKWNPCWNFREIVKLEAKYDAKSSFYFLALNPGETDFNYNIKDIESELGFISDSGWEVGLHGGHESYNSLEDLKEKKSRLEEALGKRIIGYRNHFLRFSVPVTWELLSKVGFKYDTTLGYPDCAGFRNGMCHPFRPFNLNEGRQIDILEIPLVIMDRSFFRDYMRLDVKKAWECTKHLINTVERYNGVITILWHNNTCIEGENLKYYEKVLEYCAGKDAWITSGEEIYNWWTSQVEPGIQK